MNLRELRSLLRLLREHDLEEVEIEEAGRRIRLRRRAAPFPAVSPEGLPPPQTAAPATTHPAPSRAQAAAPRLAITAPMVGTFYRAPAPGAEPFVKEGDLVEKGTVVCIIEAMKLINEIESEMAGEVTKIHP